MYHVLILHFDDTYFYQRNLRKKAFAEIDLRSLKETKFMCPEDRLKLIEKRIPLHQSLITFIGKGDYHYISFLFLKRIKEHFALLVIDNHLDMRAFNGDIIRCDSWIYRAGFLKNLKEIFYINSSNIGKIFEVKLPIYLSIDKDIIDKKHLNTRWTQGSISPQQLFNFLFNLLSNNKIIAADICGEPELDIEELRKSEKINLKIVEILQSLKMKKSA
ncbi:hypothetical protein [Thermodesulfovibrio sp. 3462-1]|jgi:arginase family enzyme|uniref:Arginase family protein n=2 Tax=Thermodesulfovibrio TaxID=28261 RepID=A0A2J6WQE5_9BACT|nr:MAG: hypothetical protein C0186_01420 [Thermodesulfovibrio aggregans]